MPSSEKPRSTGAQPFGLSDPSAGPFSSQGSFSSTLPDGQSADLGSGVRPAPVVPAPTWRDLPYEPPYGQVRPPRTPNIREPQAPVVVEDEPTITAKQIALGIGGALLLLALVIGITLVVLGDDDDEVVDADPPIAQQPIDPQPQQPPAPDPVPLPTTPPATQAPADPGAAEDLPSTDAPLPGDEPAQEEPGELQPDETPEAQTPPEPNPELAPDAEPPAEELPDAIPPPETPPQDQADIDLPRLFELRRLPAGTSEGSTTVRQTSGNDSEPVTEQTTILDTDEDEEYSIVATRADDAAARFGRLLEDSTSELTVSGVDAIITEDGGLAYLVDGDVDTLIVIDGPDSAEADALVVVAQGLELLQ